MKRHWDEQELAEHWSLTHDEFELLRNRTERSRIGFAVLLKFFQVEGRFPSDRKEVPAVALDYLGDQLEASSKAFSEYDWSGRSGKRDREQVRSFLGFRRVTVDDSKTLGAIKQRYQIRHRNRSRIITAISMALRVEAGSRSGVPRRQRGGAAASSRTPSSSKTQQRYINRHQDCLYVG